MALALLAKRGHGESRQEVSLHVLGLLGDGTVVIEHCSVKVVLVLVLVLVKVLLRVLLREFVALVSVLVVDNRLRISSNLFISLDFWNGSSAGN